METVDLIALLLVGLALARGAFIGIVREVFSVAALVGGIGAARFLGAPVGRAIAEQFPEGPGPGIAAIVAGFVIGVAVALAIGFAGRALKRGIHAAGLGGPDRVAGGLLGAAEGTLVAGLALWLAVTVVGPDHRLLRDTKSVAWLEQTQLWVRSEPTPTHSMLAAPPRFTTQRARPDLPSDPAA